VLKGKRLLKFTKKVITSSYFMALYI